MYLFPALACEQVFAVGVNRKPDTVQKTLPLKRVRSRTLCRKAFPSANQMGQAELLAIPLSWQQKRKDSNIANGQGRRICLPCR